MEFVTSHFDNGKASDIIFLGFSKAFDKVARKVGQEYLERYYIQWLYSWLSDRHQIVIIHGWASEWAAVISGFPQCSILGPILFLIYTNDIDDVVTSLIDIIRKFADDTKIAKQIISHQACL